MVLPERYTLVVIDIQPEFAKAANHVLKPVRREMEQAVADDQPIVLVEYDGCGPTLLLPVVSDYFRVQRVTKHQDGGGWEVRDAIRHRNFPRSRLRVCGVNTDCCVHSTVADLSLTIPLVEVVEPACWSNWEGNGLPANHNQGIRQMAQYSKVKIVGAK